MFKLKRLNRIIIIVVRKTFDFKKTAHKNITKSMISLNWVDINNHTTNIYIYIYIYIYSIEYYILLIRHYILSHCVYIKLYRAKEKYSPIKIKYINIKANIQQEYLW